MGLYPVKILFNKPSSQRWDTSDSYVKMTYAIIRKSFIFTLELHHGEIEKLVVPSRAIKGSAGR
jgi:hypothetical protein